jgi:hypothetical protein
VCWAIGLGVLLRLLRYGLNFPIWWNEAFLAVNFLHRDYAELLGALDYNQVCPPLFLWAERAAVDLLGFREWTLRLAPLLSGVLALVLFARIAWNRLVPSAAFLSVLMLAVAFHPVRLAAETKPYSTDLLASVILLSIAIEALDPRRRTRALICLCPALPLALGFSYPAVFVAAAIALVLAPELARRGRLRDRLLFAVMLLLFAVTLFAIRAFCMDAQARVADRAGMADGWSEAFPTSWAPGDLLAWLATTHTGPIFAFPAGEEGVASIITLVLAALGVGRFACERRVELVTLLLLPFALTALASIAGRYPYGGHPRITQYLVPALALLSGNGLDSLLSRMASSPGFSRPYRLVTLLLVVLGVVPAVGDVMRPYRSATDRAARDFAREFWPQQPNSGPTLCLRQDLRVLPWESPNPEVPVYLCNRAIYDPRAEASRRDGGGLAPRFEETPLRCVAYYSPGLESLEVFPVREWLERLRQANVEVRRTSYDLDHWGSRPARIVVFDCRPGRGVHPGSVAGTRVQ